MGKSTIVASTKPAAYRLLYVQDATTSSQYNLACILGENSTLELNPVTEDQADVTSVTQASSLTGYKPQYSVSKPYMTADPIDTMVMGFINGNKVGGDLNVKIMRVEIGMNSGGNALEIKNAYKASAQIQPQSLPNEAGQLAQISYNVVVTSDWESVTTSTLTLGDAIITVTT